MHLRIMLNTYWTPQTPVSFAIFNPAIEQPKQRINEKASPVQLQDNHISSKFI